MSIPLYRCRNQDLEKLYFFILLFIIILSKGSRNLFKLGKTNTCSSLKLPVGLPAPFPAGITLFGGIGEPASVEE